MLHYEKLAKLQAMVRRKAAARTASILSAAGGGARSGMAGAVLKLARERGLGMGDSTSGSKLMAVLAR